MERSHGQRRWIFLFTQRWNKCTQKERTYTQKPLFCKSLTFPAHSCTLCVALASAWFRALVWSYNQLNRRRRTLNPSPSLCYAIYTPASRWRNKGMSQAQGGTEQVITFCELVCDRTRSCTHTRTRTHTGLLARKQPSNAFWLLGTGFCQCHINGQGRCDANQLLYCLQRWRVISSVALKNRSRQTPIIISESFGFLSRACWFSL